MAFTLSIITPERASPEVQADHVTVVAVDGQLGIRTGHAPIVALVKDPGYVVVRSFSSDQYRAFAVRGGVAQMLDNRLKILTPAMVDVHALDAVAIRKRADAEKDPQAKAWLEHQLTVAAQFPATPGRV